MIRSPLPAPATAGRRPVFRMAATLALGAALLAGLSAHAQDPAKQEAKPEAKPEAAGQPVPSSRAYLTQFLVPGSHFHGIHGLAFDRDDQLYAGSVVGQSIYKIEPESGDVETRVPPPEGMADDIAFGPDGSMAWTSFLLGTIHYRPKPDQPLKAIATDLPGINSIAFNKEGRLFATQVFLGDALYEIDPTGAKPPRKIMEKMGGLNGFDFGPDGLLYGPLWFKGQVVKIDVDKATLTVVADGFKIPAAANFDSKGNLYVVDTALGQVVRVDVNSGQKTLVATVKTAIDNLAIDSRDRVFITNMADNGIYLVDTTTGQSRTIVEGKLAIPGDLAVVADGKGETVYVADTFAFRSVDGQTGQVHDILRMQGDELEYPSGISANAKTVLLTSWFTNSVQRVERQSGKSHGILHDFRVPVDAIELDDGSLLVLELGAGELTRVKGADGKDRSSVTKGLNVPTAIVPAGKDAVYVSETGTGSILRIELSSGAKTVVASGLAGPEGLDVTPDGKIVVAEVGQRRVLEIDPKTGKSEIVASNLAMGLPAPKGMPPAFVPTGVAVGKSGAIYVSSDIRNAIYKITPQN